MEGRRACRWRMLSKCFFPKPSFSHTSNFLYHSLFLSLSCHSFLQIKNKRKLEIHVKECSGSQNEGVKISFSKGKCSKEVKLLNGPQEFLHWLLSLKPI